MAILFIFEFCRAGPPRPPACPPQCNGASCRERPLCRSAELAGKNADKDLRNGSVQNGPGVLAELIRRFQVRYGEKNDTYSHLKKLEYLFVDVLLQDSKKNPFQYYKEMVKLAGGEEFDFNVLDQLRKYKLNHPAERTRWAERLQQSAEQFINLLEDGQIDYREPYSMVSQSVFRKNNINTQLDWKALLTLLCHNLQDRPHLQNQLQSLLPRLNFYQCRSFLQELAGELGCLRGLRRRKSLRERLQETSVSIKEALVKKDSAKTSLEEENEDLRASLEITQLELQNLQEAIDEIRSEAQMEACLTFFQEMNSLRHGNLLDAFARAEGRLQQLRREGYAVPEEIEAVPLLIRQFMKFVRDYGISPLKSPGEELEVTLEESLDYDYVGSDFEGPCQAKLVKVTGSGWEYCSNIISKPAVLEIKGQNSLKSLLYNKKSIFILEMLIFCTRRYIDVFYWYCYYSQVLLRRGRAKSR